MNNRYLKILELYKKASTGSQGFPFLNWFKEDAERYNLENKRLYLPLYTADESGQSDRSNKTYELITKLIYKENPELKSLSPGEIDIDLSTGEIFKVSKDKRFLLIKLNGKYFSKVAKKEILNSQEFMSIPEENFKSGRSEFIKNVIANQTFLQDSNLFRGSLMNVVKMSYIENEGSKFDPEGLYILLFNLISDTQHTASNFLGTFAKSKDSEEGGSKLLVVISYNEDDIINMSNERNWTSCTTEGSSEARMPYCEVEGGGFIAYLIEANDKNVENPLSRVLIRRLDNVYGDSIAAMENAIYGIKNIAFQDTVENWLKEKQGEIELGAYSLKGGRYSDTFKDHNVLGDKNTIIEGLKDISEEDQGFVIKDRITNIHFDYSSSYKALCRQMNVIQGSPFFKTKNEAEKLILSISPEKNMGEHYADIARTERVLEELEIEGGDVAVSFEDAVEYFENNHLADLLSEIEDLESRIFMTKDDIETFQKVQEVLKDDPDFVRSLQRDLVEAQEELADKEQEEKEARSLLDYNEDERKIIELIDNPHFRFEIRSTDKKHYMRALKQYNSPMYGVTVSTLQNLAKEKNDIPRKTWDELALHLDDTGRINLYLNNPIKFKAEFKEVLLAAKDRIEEAERVISSDIVQNDFDLSEAVKKGKVLHTYYYVFAEEFCKKIGTGNVGSKNYYGSFIKKGVSSEDAELKTLSEGLRLKVQEVLKVGIISTERILRLTKEELEKNNLKEKLENISNEQAVRSYRNPNKDMPSLFLQNILYPINALITLYFPLSDSIFKFYLDEKSKGSLLDLFSEFNNLIFETFDEYKSEFINANKDKYHSTQLARMSHGGKVVIDVKTSEDTQRLIGLLGTKFFRVLSKNNISKNVDDFIYAVRYETIRDTTSGFFKKIIGNSLYDYEYHDGKDAQDYTDNYKTTINIEAALSLMEKGSLSKDKYRKFFIEIYNDIMKYYFYLNNEIKKLDKEKKEVRNKKHVLRKRLKDLSIKTEELLQEFYTADEKRSREIKEEEDALYSEVVDVQDELRDAVDEESEDIKNINSVLNRYDQKAQTAIKNAKRIYKIYSLTKASRLNILRNILYKYI